MKLMQIVYYTEAQVNQWIAKNNWKDQGDGYVFIANQEDSIKTKNITEKITFEGWNVSFLHLVMFSFLKLFLLYLRS